MKRHLTKEEKEEIWRVIWREMTDDDRDPWDVISTDYEGNEEEYLKAMARYHNIIFRKKEKRLRKTRNH